MAPGPAKRAEKIPGAPSSASASIPESSAIAARPRAAAAARALPSAFAANVSPSSGGSVDARRQRLERDAAEHAPELAQLVIVAGGEHEPHARAYRTAAACAARSPSIPCCASASSSSRCVRESGVRSAVACTSTSPPSPVMTTFASTSAVESSP